MIEVERTEVFEAVYESGEAGLVGTVAVAIIDNDGGINLGPLTTGITENVVDGIPTGVYTAELTAPWSTGQYTIVWSKDGTFNPIGVATEDLLVETESALAPPPIGPALGGGLAGGPCNAWTTSDDVALCCNVEIGSDTDIFDNAVVQASQLLFELSGRRFNGACEKTVRPCSGGGGCGFQVLSRGHLVFPDGDWGWSGTHWRWPSLDHCGCSPLSRILLSGYPVREITEVKIDGDVVDPATYRLDESRYLVRVRDPADPDTALGWPSCQSLDLEDTEVGTFSVTYEYGAGPPALGAAAAAQLACEFYKLCVGSGDCVLPAGTTRATRQGLTIERTAVVAWAWKSGIGWQTSLSLVDAFLSAYAGTGARRRAVIWSPDAVHYARPVGSS